MRRRWVPAAAVLAALSLPAAADAYRYGVPVQRSSPWPEMRHDRRNTAASPVQAAYHGDRPWGFTTGKGIFSTPFVAGDGTIYVGSADTYFYAIAPKGHTRRREIGRASRRARVRS